MIEIDRLKDILHISIQVKESAAVIYRKILAKGLVRERSISAIAAASLYIACLLTSVKKTQKKISKTANITEVTLRNKSKELKEKIIQNF